MRGPAFFAYANNCLVDVKFGVIVDVEASRAIRQAKVSAAKTKIGRNERRFGLKPERLAQTIRPGKRYGRSLLPFLAASAGGRNSKPPARSPTSGSRRVFSLGGFPPHHWH